MQANYTLCIMGGDGFHTYILSCTDRIFHRNFVPWYKDTNHRTETRGDHMVCSYTRDWTGCLRLSSRLSYGIASTITWKITGPWLVETKQSVDNAWVMFCCHGLLCHQFTNHQPSTTNKAISLKMTWQMQDYDAVPFFKDALYYSLLSVENPQYFYCFLICDVLCPTPHYFRAFAYFTMRALSYLSIKKNLNTISMHPMPLRWENISGFLFMFGA